jgi:hypothetical protein
MTKGSEKENNNRSYFKNERKRLRAKQIAPENAYCRKKTNKDKRDARPPRKQKGKSIEDQTCKKNLFKPPVLSMKFFAMWTSNEKSIPTFPSK